MSLPGTILPWALLRILLISPQCRNTAEGKRPTRRPRTRACLLKGCERRFRPVAARQRYCSPQCRQAARQWSRWKAQQRYRATAAAKEKRQEQSRRYRERVKERKQAAQPEAVPEAARVITNNFFRALLRPAWLLRRIRPATKIAAAALLFTGLPARRGTRLATRAALAPGAAAALEEAQQCGGR